MSRTLSNLISIPTVSVLIFLLLCILLFKACFGFTITKTGVEASKALSELTSIPADSLVGVKCAAISSIIRAGPDYFVFTADKSLVDSLAMNRRLQTCSGGPVRLGRAPPSWWKKAAKYTEVPIYYTVQGGSYSSGGGGIEIWFFQQRQECYILHDGS